MAWRSKTVKATPTSRASVLSMTGGLGGRLGVDRDLSAKGYSSATVDGGATWAAANQIGLFINRFRFFGNPVTVGYASGDTIYKYSSDPLPAAAAVLALAQDAAVALLPDRRIIAARSQVPIGMRVPVGTKRLTLDVWDRFGVEVGRLLDEIRPRDGQRVFNWDGMDAQGAAVRRATTSSA